MRGRAVATVGLSGVFMRDRPVYLSTNARLSHRWLLSALPGVLCAAAEHRDDERAADERPLRLYEHGAQAPWRRRRGRDRGRLGRGEACVPDGGLPRVQGPKDLDARGA